jgi:predicted Zn-dependent protease
MGISHEGGAVPGLSVVATAAAVLLAVIVAVGVVAGRRRSRRLAAAAVPAVAQPSPTSATIITAEAPVDPIAAAETEWYELRAAYWRERVAVLGGPDDYVGLVRVLLRDHHRGAVGAMDEASDVLLQGRQRHPRAVIIWEYVVLISARLNRTDELNDALATVERLDPNSRVLAILDRTSPEETQRYQENVNETHRRLLDQLTSGEIKVREAAVEELAQWARAYPANSTYVINYGLGLMILGRHDEARDVALGARTIEDGSFADAYNIGIILQRSENAAGTAMLRAAVDRAGSEDERELAEQALTRAAS